VKTSSDTVTQYLLELAEDLEVLGPAETEEILHEVRTHITEAVAEAGGDERAALAAFDSPEEFAYRILEERGVTSGAVAPTAPPWMRVAAHVIDVAAWVFVSLLFSPIAALLAGLILWPFHPSDESSVRLTVTVIILVCFALAIGWFYWISRRNSHGFQTTGMDVMGLRRVSVGRGMRTVRRRDIPGLPKRRLGRAWAIAMAVIVVGLLGAALVNGVVSSSHYRRVEADARVSNAINYSSQASAQVSHVYQMVTAGTPVNEIEGYYTFVDQRILSDLESRKASGELGSYQLLDVDIPDPDQLEGMRFSTGHLDAVVQIAEHAPVSDEVHEFEYHLKLDWSDGTGAFVFESYN
jgi:uncharacterized membrane protein